MILNKLIQKFKNRNKYITPIRFDRYVKKLDNKKFSITRTVTYSIKYDHFYVIEWHIYRRNVYINSHSGPTKMLVLDSEHNTLKDIKKLIKSERKLEK